MSNEQAPYKRELFVVEQDFGGNWLPLAKGALLTAGGAEALRMSLHIQRPSLPDNAYRVKRYVPAFEG